MQVLWQNSKVMTEEAVSRIVSATPPLPLLYPASTVTTLSYE